MTRLYFTTRTLSGPKLGKPSRFPALKDAVETEFHAAPGECDELFVGYGQLHDPLPYTMQGDYDGPEMKQNFRAAVLENDHLRAEFLPELGSRLWSLFDKDEQRELLFVNSEFKLGNLAIRNAWLAGGVEWNIGRRGHDAQTCSPRFCATLNAPDGSPVLRFYEFNRDRVLPFQLDIMLPPDSRFLLVRCRIENTNDVTVPMYWWSNIAVPESPEQRVIVPAFKCYRNRYAGGKHYLGYMGLPNDDGLDCTRPGILPNAIDYFFDLPDDARKYEAVLDGDGFGLVQASTSRLIGRKLFVWGQGQGGQHWQRKLVGTGQPNYIEIQAGLCKTQTECRPMPPHAVWEWLEAYGSLRVEPAQVFGKWPEAVDAATARLDTVLPQSRLEEILEKTRDSVALRPGKIISSGSGWGALEELRRGKKLVSHLEFGTPDAEQAPWVKLLEIGHLCKKASSSYMVQDEWFNKLKQIKQPNPAEFYHLGINYFRRENWTAARRCLKRAGENAWSFHALAHVERRAGHPLRAAKYAVKALECQSNVALLAKELLKLLMETGSYRKMLFAHSLLSPQVQKSPQVRFLYATALAHTGKIASAEKIMAPLDPRDIREGEISLSELFIYIQQHKASDAGKILDFVEVPFQFDLRMTAPKR